MRSNHQNVNCQLRPCQAGRPRYSVIDSIKLYKVVQFKDERQKLEKCKKEKITMSL